MKGEASLATSPAPAGVPVTVAARRLGLSPSTLRSWERRYGLGPSLRTPGGHRRYSAADLAALQQLQQLIADGMATATAARAVTPRVPPHASTSGPRDPARRLTAAVDGLDTGRALRSAEAVITERGPAAAWTDVFAPLLQRLGERWGATGDGIELGLGAHPGAGRVQGEEPHAWPAARAADIGAQVGLRESRHSRHGRRRFRS